MSKGNPWSESQIGFMADARGRGLSYRQIADGMPGRSIWAVTAAVRYYGFTAKPDFQPEEDAAGGRLSPLWRSRLREMRAILHAEVLEIMATDRDA